MKRLDNLPQIAQRQLGGLEANPTILAKAKLAAAEGKPAHSFRLRPVLALCTALVLCVGAVASLTAREPAVVAPDTAVNVIDSRSAGSDAGLSVEPRTLGDVPSGAISMSGGMRRADETLFAEPGNASFPLITLNDATYRLLVTPSGISPDLLGEELGTVSEFNVEPALGSSGVVSNAVARGESVYAIEGMNGALAAASVDGVLRVFQRVSYAGTAVIGSETLADTLCAPEQAAWIELSGIGRVDDAAQAARLVGILLDCADYQGTAMSGSSSMRIGLSNGLTMQLLIGEDTVSACGTWSCPDFFEAFAQAVQ